MRPRPIVTVHSAWLVGLSVGRSVTVVSHAKTVEPIGVPSGFFSRYYNIWFTEPTRVLENPNGIVIYIWGPERSAVRCAKTAEPIETPYVRL